MVPAGRALVRVPDDQPSITAALTEIAGDGVVEITDNGRYEEALDIQVVADGAVEIRASNGRRPTLVLSGLSIAGAVDSACLLNGLLIAGAALQVPAVAGNALARLELSHCTLVPGITLDAAGQPLQPNAASLVLEIPGLEVQIDRCLLGAIRAHEHAQVAASDSLIDATARDGVAFAAGDGASPGAVLSLSACTLVGKVHTAEVGLISNSILFAALAQGDSWAVPVRAARKQLREFEQRAAVDPLQPDLFAQDFAAPEVEASEPEPHPALEQLAVLDPDSLTPREALEALYALKGLLR